MRFFESSPSIPDLLLNRRDAGRVVFFCGAGVSFNSGMPDFFGLTKHVIETFDPPSSSAIMQGFNPWLEGHASSAVSLDQIFNLLQQEYGRNEVNELVAARLSQSEAKTTPSREHQIIRRISSDTDGNSQIVTTNFDTLFEASFERTIKHVPPALPNLSLGMPITGVSYLHGRLPDASTYQYPFVLSSADFGRAYLAEGWATKFVRDLLSEYTVVLVGYQAEDPPIKYLLQGLNHDGRSDRSNLFAFDRGKPDEIEAKWRDRGVTPIAYPEHDVLWNTLDAWAERADDPRQWRSSIISKTANDPKSLKAHERGQVAHLLRTNAGAKAFQLADPIPHPEWICVLDAGTRAAKASSGYGDEAEKFEPLENYGLDDDPPRPKDGGRQTQRIHENLLEWNRDDENPSTAHRLGGRQWLGREDIPPRLFQLTNWFGKSLNSPAMAWWAARQNGLHPRLIDSIRYNLLDQNDLHPKARQVWNLIIEHQSDQRQFTMLEGLYDLKRRVAKEGWTSAVLREFATHSLPMIKCSSGLGLSAGKPPEADWEDVNIGDIAAFEVVFPEHHGEELEIPDEMLAKVIPLLAKGFMDAADMLDELGTSYFETPTCYPGRDVDGDDQYRGFYHDVRRFISLFDRLVVLDPAAASVISKTWPVSTAFFLRSFRLYAANQPNVTPIGEAFDVVAALDDKAFWETDCQRELMFLIADRWDEFSDQQQAAICQRILSGFDNPGHLTDEEFMRIMVQMVLRRGRWLQKQGCAWPKDQAQELDTYAASLTDWSDDYAQGTMVKHGVKGGWVGTDNNPEAVVDLPVSQIIDRATEDLEREFDSLTDRRPFSGLVTSDPRRAIAALTYKGKRGEYPETFWSSLIRDWPEDTSDRLTKLMLHRVSRLPYEALIELKYTVGDWLREKLPIYMELDGELAWSVFDHCVSALVSDRSGSATESGLGETRVGGEVINKSRRTYGHAINGPIGELLQGLTSSLSALKIGENAGIPPEYKARIERLLAAPGEGSDHAVAVLARDIPWLDHIDPEWTSARLTPLLAFDHPAAEPAWNGFLSRGKTPNFKVLSQIKPLLLDLFPWLYSFGWDRDLAKVAANWLMWMALFHRGEEHGITSGEARDCLRKMSSETRQNVIFWLGQVGKGNEDGWAKLVGPFIEKVWPREKAIRTSATVTSWIAMLDDTGADFPVVYQAVKPHLVPVEGESHWLYRFTREVGGEKPITAEHPSEVLDMMDTIIPSPSEFPPYELKQILDVISESDEQLVGDPRFNRLLALTESK